MYICRSFVKMRPRKRPNAFDDATDEVICREELVHLRQLVDSLAKQVATVMNQQQELLGGSYGKDADVSGTRTTPSIGGAAAGHGVAGIGDVTVGHGAGSGAAASPYDSKSNKKFRSGFDGDESRQVEADVNDKYSVPNTTIHTFAKSGDLSGFKRLLQDDPSRLCERSVFLAQTPLHISADNNKVEIVKYLLDWKGPGKVELEAKNVYGETPLHLAAKNGCHEVARMLLSQHANIEAKTINGWTPLHLSVFYALESGEYSTMTTLLDYNANCFAEDKRGLIPLHYVPDTLDNEELRRLSPNFEVQRHHAYIEDTHSGGQGILDKLDCELSKLVGLHELKVQLRKWAKGMILDKKRWSMGIDLGPRKAPHMVFLGNPGTGKTTVARVLGKLLHSVGFLSSNSVTEVQRTDLVGEYLGQTGSKTREKIEEAKGGILFVDEAYRLVIKQTVGYQDYGVEALEEIMSVLEDGDILVIFAGYTKPMKRVMSSNEGLCRRVTHFFHFDDFSSRDLAEIVQVKMTKQKQGSQFYGFKLHPFCTLEAITAVIEKGSTVKLRNKMNGGLVDHILTNAKENLDTRLSLDCEGYELLTITLNDLEVGLQQLSSRVNID
ncbi:unnamed protein product [Fraxinus pennsylvanica]|uniref:AAA+ ATPase domain-containing protein n=1 Tax=Fraxinus pennsylvanica TaxID=56036 RepID=A0AAD2A7G8_9LAMI|nr:unnamed protein product [Fraxinus pennsylvanica]